MGTFNVGCLIKKHVNREKAVEIPRVLLERIDVQPEKRQAYRMANGQQVYRDVGYAIIRVGLRETTDEVVFAETGDFVLLGARAMEGLMLWVDSKNKKLIEIEASPVAKVIVPGNTLPDKDRPFATGLVIQGVGGPPPIAEKSPRQRMRPAQKRG